MVVDASSANRANFAAEVLSNVVICREHFRLTFRVQQFPSAAPGQFIEILCRRGDEAPSHRDRPRLLTWQPGAPLAVAADEFHGRSAFLRRPFSIAGLRRTGDDCELDVIGRDIGPGTHALMTMRPGERTEVIGPLGQPFSLHPDASAALLVAGGVGLPPLLWLAEALRAAGRRTIAIVGARSGDLIPLTITSEPPRDGTAAACAAEFARLGVASILTTDDGSRGLRGTTVAGFGRALDQLGPDAARAVVYTCGPERMMHAVADAAAAARLRCQVCLERVMGCGMGTCQSCVVRVRDESAERGWRFELCCTQGPAFDAARVVW